MLVELEGNLWDRRWYEDGYWRVVPTNLAGNPASGLASMGAGVALQAATRFSSLRRDYGKWLQEEHAGIIASYPDRRLLLFPTKGNPREISNILLIKEGAIELREFLVGSMMQVVMPQIGAGLGTLDWEQEVKPVLVEYLGDIKNNVIALRRKGV